MNIVHYVHIKNMRSRLKCCEEKQKINWSHNKWKLWKIKIKTVVVIQKKIFICNCFWQIPIINGRRNLVLWFTSTIQIDNNGIMFNREICSTQLLITHWKCNEMWTNWLTKAFGRLSTRQLLTYIIITTTTHLFLT